MMPTHPQILLIGLDGLNFDLINRLIPARVMPTLHRLLSQGASGPLRSVFPTHSAAAWGSLMTGQEPAGHKIFDFKVRLPDGRYRHALPEKKDTLWKILGDNGVRTGVFNFPVTYPPFLINGWMVSGMLTPSLSRMTAPASLTEELLEEFPDYRLDVEWTLFEGREKQLLEELTAMVRQRGDAACWLFNHDPVDCFAMAFIATDRAQHALWKFIDPQHPYYDSTLAERLQVEIHGFYAALDEALGKVLSLAGPETLLIALSDHGFQPVAWQFQVNDWLASKNWLAYKQGSAEIIRKLRNLEPTRLKKFRQRFIQNPTRFVTAFAPGAVIDWSATTAFCPWNFQQGVRINLEGRDPFGMVAPGEEFNRVRSEIKSALEGLVHEESSNKVVHGVIEYDYGPTGSPQTHPPDLPDLIIDVNPNYAIGLHRQTLFEPTGWASGDHHLMGLVGLSGAGVLPGQVSDAGLVDIAPTVLWRLNIPIPKKMTGSPIRSHVKPGQYTPEVSTDEEADTQVEGEALSDEEEAKMLKQLKDLGYL